MGKNKKSSKKSKSKKSAVAPASHDQQQIDVDTVKPEPAASKETTGEPSGSKTLAGGVRKRYHGVSYTMVLITIAHVNCFNNISSYYR